VYNLHSCIQWQSKALEMGGLFRVGPLYTAVQVVHCTTLGYIHVDSVTTGAFWCCAVNNLYSSM
jgi:hypothetical protein